MDRKLKFILVFLGSGAAMFLIFYFYQAEIFDVNVIGSVATKEVEVSLQTFLGIDNSFKDELALSNLTYERKLSGWMILIIITVGMPLMFAYRSLIQKNPTESKE